MQSSRISTLSNAVSETSVPAGHAVNAWAATLKRPNNLDSTKKERHWFCLPTCFAPNGQVCVSQAFFGHASQSVSQSRFNTAQLERSFCSVSQSVHHGKNEEARE
jgi:hypothetical protein